MDSFDDIKKRMPGLSPRERVKIWEEYFRTNPEAQKRRRKAFADAFGCLNEEDGKAFEDALWSGRQISEETLVDLGAT